MADSIPYKFARESSNRADDGEEDTSAAGYSSAAPSGQHAQTLRQRLEMTEEWNVRLQHQLQELLDLPQCEVEALKERMQNPEIALPLLQCYDAAIQEKEDRIAVLMKEVEELRLQVEAKGRREKEWADDVEVTEGILDKVQRKGQAAVQEQIDRCREMELEMQQMRMEMRRALEAATNAEKRAEDAERSHAQLSQSLEHALASKRELEDALETLRRANRQHSSVLREGELERETQRVKVHALTRDNEEKLKELEMVRVKMMNSLRQAGENHATHLRVVEERHRLAVEDLRQANRTHELEILKLRSQLARLDPNNAVGAQLSRLRDGSSTTSLLENQVRQAQDLEIKRLYAELGNMQRQRDEALDRAHQHGSILQEKERGLLEDHRREYLSVQKRVQDLRTALDHKSAACGRLEVEVVDCREKLHTAESEILRLRLSRDSLQRQVEELKRLSEEKIVRAEESVNESVEKRRKDSERIEAAERRVDEVLSDLQRSRDVFRRESAAHERERSGLQDQLAATRKQLQETEQTLGKRDREHEVLSLQMQKLKESIETHRKQLLQSDAKLVETHRNFEELKRQQRTSLIALEQLKLENGRLQQVCSGLGR